MPSGNEAVVTVKGGGAMVMLRSFVAVRAGVVESVTFTVKFAVPKAVGVPSITPVAECNVNPAGNEPPVTLHATYGFVPPVAARVVAA